MVPAARRLSAPRRGHREIADWLVGQGVSDWWAQKLIVEYEQDRGLRQPVARTGGSFAGGASKTLPFSIDRLYAAFADSELRRSWLPRPRAHRAYGSAATVDQVRRGRRFRGERGVRRERGGKAQVAVEQEALPDAAAAEQAKRDCRRRLAGLKEWLAG
jgi:hypothetical protein